MSDNPNWHRGSRGCLETSDGRVSPAADATRVDFHQHITPIFALSKHALKRARAEDLVPLLRQRWVLQVVREHGESVHLPQLLVVDLGREQRVEKNEARLVARNDRSTLLTTHLTLELFAQPAATTAGEAGAPWAIRPSR